MEIMILSLLMVGSFFVALPGVGLGLVRARLATCYSDARALYRFLVLLLLRPDARVACAA